MCNKNCTCSQNDVGTQKKEQKGEDLSHSQEWKKPPQPAERGDQQYSVLVGIKSNHGEPIWKSWGTLISDRHVLTNSCQVGSDDAYLVRACHNRDFEVMTVSNVAGDSDLCILTLRDSTTPLTSTAPHVFKASMGTYAREHQAERDPGSFPHPQCKESSSNSTSSPTLTQQYTGAWSQAEKPYRGKPRSRSPPCEYLATEYPPQFKSPTGTYGSAKCGNFEVGGLGSGQALLAVQPVRDFAVYATTRKVSTEKKPTVVGIKGGPLHGRNKSPTALFHHQFVSSLRQYPNMNPKIASFFPEALDLLKNLPPINKGSWQNESGQQTPPRPVTGYQRPQWAHHSNRRISSAATQHRKPESEEKLTRCMDYEKTKLPPVCYQAGAVQTNISTATKQTGCRPRSVAERIQRVNVGAAQRPAKAAAMNSANSRRCSSNASGISASANPVLTSHNISNCCPFPSFPFFKDPPL